MGHCGTNELARNRALLPVCPRLLNLASPLGNKHTLALTKVNSRRRRPSHGIAGPSGTQQL